MLYGGFLRFSAQAREAMVNNDLGTAGLRLSRAQDIATELRVTLDMSQGAIAENLAALYVYVGERLTEARLKKDPAQIDAAVHVMSELRSAWAEVANTRRPQRTTARPAVGVNLAG